MKVDLEEKKKSLTGQKLLLVDDEPDVTSALKRLLRKEEYEVHTCNNPLDAISLIEQNQYSVIISDQRMPEMQGSELLSIAKEKSPNSARMILSGYADFEAVTDAINNGAIFKFLSKPWDNEKIKLQIRDAFEHADQSNINHHMGKIYDHMSDAVMICSHNGRIEFVNSAFEMLVGLEKSEVEGRGQSILANYLDLQSHEKDIKIALERDNQFSSETLCSPPEQPPKITEMKITREIDPTSNLNIDIFIFKDISHDRAKLEELEQMFYHDVISGLPNLFAIKKRIAEQIVEANNLSEDNKFHVLYIRLDRLKEYISDFSSHETEDLIHILIQYIPFITMEDIFFGRYHDESFILVTPIGEEINFGDVPEFPKEIPFDDKNLYLNFIMGASTYPQDGDDPDTLINRAYSAGQIAEKTNTHHSIEVYNHTVDSTVNQSIKMENELFLAHKNNEFTIFYQPLLNLKNKKIEKIEALIRWHHPEKGMISPGQFIPVAEESGLIIPIGEWVIYQACEETKKLQELGFHDISVAINLSAKQFQQDRLEDILKDVLKETKLSVDQIELEITESMVMQNSKESVEKLKNLKDIGFKLSLDDFGTGYSSLSYLKFFPFDTLKIDQSFIANILEDEVDEKIVDAITQMAQSLSLKLVAEGIENQEQFDLMTDKQCDLGQGYLISKPLPYFELVKLIKRGWAI